MSTWLGWVKEGPQVNKFEQVQWGAGGGRPMVPIKWGPPVNRQTDTTEMDGKNDIVFKTI